MSTEIGTILRAKRVVRTTRLQFTFEIDATGPVNEELDSLEIDDADTAAAVAWACFGSLGCSFTQENFGALYLNARGHMVGFGLVCVGTLTACLIHPREVFAPALELRAATLMLAHNHPSGDHTPSPEDVAITVRMIEAGKIIGVPVVDHVVIDGFGGFSSIAFQRAISRVVEDRRVL